MDTKEKSHKSVICATFLFWAYLSSLLAEREGFEPPVPRSTTVFKTAAIDHSAISPVLLNRGLFLKSVAKICTFF